MGDESNESSVCNLNICKGEHDFRLYHRGIYNEDIEETRKKAKIHCQECKQVIPFHLLRGVFYRIIESPAFFKLLVTGKGTGKSVNLAIFQAWLIMNNHQRARFVWVYRNEKDLLKKGKDLWNDVIQMHLPDKQEQGVISNFVPKDWKDSRGAHATANGVSYLGRLRVVFVCLADWDDTSGKFSGDATHFVFDEAMAGDGKYLGDKEEGYWGHIFDNVMHEGNIPTICYFLANPHTKGIWWLERYTNQEWIEKAFAKDGQKHFFEGDVYIERIKQTAPCMLYQAPAERGKFGWLINTARSDTRRQEGTYSEEVNKYIQLPMPEKFKQLRLIKNCIWAREVRSGVTEHKQFIYKRGEEEKVDSDVIHLCFDIDEFATSECNKKKRILIDKPSEMKYWLKDMLFWSLEMNKKNPLFFTGKNENRAAQAKDIIMSLIRTNLKSLDKSDRK